jgi:hypothetical protein
MDDKKSRPLAATDGEDCHPIDDKTFGDRGALSFNG